MPLIILVNCLWQFWMSTFKPQFPCCCRCCTLLEILRLGSNAVLHMSRTQLIEFGSCVKYGVWPGQVRVIAFRSAEPILPGWRRREERLKIDFGSNANLHMSRTKCKFSLNPLSPPKSFLLVFNLVRPAMFGVWPGQSTKTVIRFGSCKVRQHELWTRKKNVVCISTVFTNLPILRSVFAEVLFLSSSLTTLKSDCVNFSKWCPGRENEAFQVARESTTTLRSC